MKKAIVTYTFSDSDVRHEFEDFLIELGLKDEPDQTTYALPTAADLSVKSLLTKLNTILENFDFEPSEHVTVYYPSKLHPANLLTHRWPR